MRSKADSSLRRIARRMATGEAVDWASTPEAAADGAALQGLQVVETISRLAQAERRAIVEMTQAVADPDRVPAAGRTWGTLQLLEKIGEGSYGEVFRAHDPALQIDVAVKLWFSRWSSHPDMDAFLKEARTLARIRHPNVLTVFGAARHDDRVGMWTELLRGETLESALTQRGLFGASEAAIVGAELCRALAAVHGAGLVHRDVKTRNVMRVEGGRMVLMDFGTVAQASQLAATASDPFLVGTPLVMAPEQLAGDAIGPAADLYSLGVLLYRLVTGRYPIQASSLEELVQRHASGERTPLRDWRPDLPFGFIEVVERALAPEPGARFASAGAFEQALLRFVHSDAQPSAPLDERAAAPSGRHNLRAALTSFIGRERELAECRELLGRSRLLTLTGVGGCGKTRLALRLAEEQLSNHPEGVWNVDLAPLNDPGRVAQRLAQTLDVPEQPDRELTDSVAAQIGSKPILIVLDNCEHVLGAAAETAVSLLGACPGLRMIATSREALGVAGEATFPVPSLSLPEATARSASAVGASEAVRLFVDSAGLARTDFRLSEENASAVSEICRRLDGIPLAIELAAARVRVLAPGEILAKLDDRFRLLTGGSKWALPRHQTLLEALRWSYDLLTVEERGLLSGLAVFPGGWTIEAAQRVCGKADDPYAILDLLTRLVDKSLVLVERASHGASRYRLLETVRQFALEKLTASADVVTIRDRHLDYFLGFVEAQASALQGGADLGSALAACDTEHENVLAALAWCPQAGDGSTKALRIVASFFPYWTHRTLFSLGLDQVLRALSRPGGDRPAVERAQATFAASNLAFYRGDYLQSSAHAEASLGMYRELGVQNGIVWSLNAVANVRMIQGDFAGSRTLYEESLAVARECGYKRGEAIALNNLANLAAEANDSVSALPLFQQSAELNRELGRRVGLGLSLTNVAEAFVQLGKADSGKAALIESLQIVRENRRKDYGCYAITVGGVMAEQLGSWIVSTRLLGAAEILREGVGVRLQPAEERSLTSAVARLRQRLGNESFAKEWAEGRGLSFEPAVDFALEWLERGGRS